MSLLHTGSETGRNESKQYFGDTWKASRETRTYELEDGTRVLVTVFMADFIEGMGARAGAGDPAPVEGAYQYSVEIHPAEAYQRPMSTAYGDLDRERLTPALPGETRTLLAWEAALDEAETLLGRGEPEPPSPGEIQERTLTLSRAAWERMVEDLKWLLPATGSKETTRRVEDALASGDGTTGPFTVTVGLVEGRWGWDFIQHMAEPGSYDKDDMRAIRQELADAIRDSE